jgi:membrane protein implicated in regulation of membrane protease activity
MQHPLSEEDKTLLKKAYNADALVLVILVIIFLSGIGTIALESYHGDIPKAAITSVIIAVLVALVLVWRLKQKMKKDLEKGTFHTMEGIVESSTRSSIKVGKDYHGFASSIQNPVKKGDKVRLYMTDATKMIFKVEKIIEILPDVL